MWVSFLYLQCCLLCFLVSPPFFPPDSPVPPKYCLPSSWLFFLLNQPEWCILTVYKRLFHSIFLPRVSKYKQNPMVVCTDWGTWQGEARSWQSVSHRKSLSCSLIVLPLSYQLRPQCCGQSSLLTIRQCLKTKQRLQWKPPRLFWIQILQELLVQFFKSFLIYSQDRRKKLNDWMADSQLCLLLLSHELLSKSNYSSCCFDINHKLKA